MGGGSGGGGGGYFGRSDPESIIKKLKSAGQRTQNAELDAQVSELIGSLLSEYNDRDSEKISGYLKSIKDALTKEIEGTIDLIYGGSIAKRTYVEGLSDVDSLVILDSCELADGPPSEAKEYLKTRLQERFPKTTIREGSLAVTVHFKDAEVQLLPAVTCEKRISISDDTGKSWIKIDPQSFADALSQANRKSAGKLVPMIKIAKAINSRLPSNQQLKPYHIESLAVEIFKMYDGPKVTKHMLKHFFLESPKYVMKPILDKTQQTAHVDEYLGPSESSERRVVANTLARLGKRMRNADISGSVEEWTDLLSEG